MTRFSASSVSVRPARPDDAEEISSFCEAAYSVHGANDARQHYPFPQFMDPNWVREAVVRDVLCWMVADVRGKVVGTVGAVRNIGSPRDQVAELFGLVVSKEWRRNGIGTRLFAALFEELVGTAQFMIAETRTADAGGWRVSKAYGFQPMGFEPFAHNTPVGFEPMLLLGFIADKALTQSDGNGRSSMDVQILAESVLENLDQIPLPPVRASGFPITAESLKTFTHQSTSSVSSSVEPTNKLPKDGKEFRVVNDNVVGRELRQAWDDLDLHGSGVVSLRRLEGEDLNQNRYEKKYFVGYAGESPICCARVVCDNQDRRVRVLFMQTLVLGTQGLLLAEILRVFETQFGSTPYTVAIDVCADLPPLHATLENLGFFPTVYYPRLLASGSGRVDAVQFTRLYNCGFETNLKWAEKISWVGAANVIEVVTKLANQSRK